MSQKPQVAAVFLFFLSSFFKSFVAVKCRFFGTDAAEKCKEEKQKVFDLSASLARVADRQTECYCLGILLLFKHTSSAHLSYIYLSLLFFCFVLFFFLNQRIQVLGSGSASRSLARQHGP